ncbi:unnamed protein product [Tetraodon nigroviridis]|uniref:Transcriptional protein SWT1 n=1 Tax=Tetraodon nigroviridis TaxID=99883 RepID=Q4RJ23_TETNG|nr:unnamed protein product [Tetraodon nigroviridis]
MQVVEELHLARSKKCLEVDVTHSYGELTCMDMDLTEDGAANTLCKQPSQQDLILVLDTNILLSHLAYIKNIRSHGLADEVSFPVILIPWVVLQELDFLKRGKDLSGSVAHLAIPAISYIYNTLKNREPRLWGQSMQQAAESSYGLKGENNDDRVLQCCLQYQNLYPECALILCTNDKNLCSKAFLCGVKAFSKRDLESEAKKFKHSNLPLQNFKPSTTPHTSHQASLAVFEKTKRDVSREVCELEDCLRDVLSDVLEVEMKAVYDDLWLEVVYRKPPWSLLDVLQCLKKHWIAVFGQVIQRKKLQLVLNLINFFQSSKFTKVTLSFGVSVMSMR